MDSQANISPDTPLSSGLTPPASQQFVGTVCPYCNYRLPPNSYFCMNCGKKLKPELLSTGIFAQVWLYFLSLCLPPLGLGRTLRYIRAEDPIAKKIGWISLIMTIVSIIVAVWLSVSVIQNLNGLLDRQINGI